MSQAKYYDTGVQGWVPAFVGAQGVQGPLGIQGPLGPQGITGQASYYQTVRANGTSVTQRQRLNFVGATVTDDATNTQTTVTITSGGGGNPTPTVFLLMGA
jgi:hypothetical protein